MKTLEYSKESEQSRVPWRVWVMPGVFVAGRAVLEWRYPMASGITDNTLLRAVLELPFYWIGGRLTRLVGVPESSLGTVGYSALAVVAETAVVAGSALSVWYVMRLIAAARREDREKVKREGVGVS